MKPPLRRTLVLFVHHCEEERRSNLLEYIPFVTLLFVVRCSRVPEFQSFIVRCSLFTVRCHCSLFVVHCSLSLFVIRCSLSIVHCPLFIVHCSLFTVRCSLFAVLCSLSTVNSQLSTLFVANSNQLATIK